MFGNLIESGSHAADRKRKARFFLGTTLFYALLLLACGVGSIYAYNVRLDESHDYEVLALMRFPPAEARSEPARSDQPRPASSRSRDDQITTRLEIVTQTPYHTDRIASANAREVGPHTAVAIGAFDHDAAMPGSGPIGPDTGGVPGGGNAGRNDGPAVIEAGEAPAAIARPTPAPTPRQNEGPVQLASTIISSKAVEKPAPPYPPIARAAGIQGTVAVQIVVDEQGRVIQAKATNGNPLLQLAAMQAAYKARFTPTLLGGRPVKVTGSITYNFVLH
jgi:protein TonB